MTEVGTSEAGGSVATVRGALWSLLSTGVALPITTLCIVVVARALGAASYGRYVYITFALTMATALADLGIGGALFWSTAAGRGTREGAAAVRASNTWGLIRAPLCAVPVVVLVHGAPGVVLALAVVLLTATSGWANTLVAHRAFRQASLVGTGANVVGNLAAVVAAVSTASAGPTVAALFTGRALVLCVATLLAVDRPLRAELVKLGPVRLDPASRRYAFANYVSTVSGIWVTSRSEVVFLTRGGYDAVAGRFGVATTIASRATLLTDALFSPLNSVYVDVTQREKSEREAQLLRALRIGTALAVLTAVPAIPLGSLLAPIVFGGQYSGIEGATVALTIASLMGTATGAIHPWIQAARRARAIVVPNLVAAALDIVVCLSLLEVSPLLVAVVANVTALVVLVSGAVLLTDLSPLTRQRFAGSAGRALPVLLTCAGLTLAPWSSNRPAQLVIATTLCILVAPLVLRLVPILQSEDADVLLEGMPSRLRPALRAFITLTGLAGRSYRPQVPTSGQAPE